MEYDVLPRVSPGNVVWVWGMGGVTWTFRVIVGAWSEVIGVVSVEAMGNGHAEDGGADKVVVVSDGCLDGWWGCVSVWGSAGDVGWVVGWGVIPLDAGPHCCFGIYFHFG